MNEVQNKLMPEDFKLWRIRKFSNSYQKLFGSKWVELNETS